MARNAIARYLSVSATTQVFSQTKAQEMKGKRYSTEGKIRISREADGGKNIVEVWKEKNISEVTFHRWKKQFGQMDLNEANWLNEIERADAAI
jgi:hypothetical protein